MIELLIDNYDSGEHPIHVHGRRMYVMARGEEGSGPYNALKYPRNIADPILRDTISVAANSSIGLSINKLLSHLDDRMLLCFFLQSLFNPAIGF